MKPYLRAAIPSDYELVATWISDAAECVRWAGPGIPFPFAGRDLPGLLEGTPSIVIGESRASFVLVEPIAAEAQPQIAAFAQLVCEDSANFRLARIVVAPDKRGRGVGTVLCEILLEKVKATPGARTLRLFVHQENVTAARIYAKLGFVVSPPHPWPDVLTMKRAI